MAGYWLKLYTEILEDPKYHRLSDNAKLGMIELMLVAKKTGVCGEIPNIEDVAFYTRRSVEWWQPVFEELSKIEYLVTNGSETIIRKFAERQSAVDDSIRMKKYRELKHKNEFAQRECNEPVTNRNGDSETETDKSREEKINSAPVNFSSSRPAIETNYTQVWVKSTGQLGIPVREQPKVIDAIDILRPKFKSDDELITFLKPYYEHWCNHKTKDNKPYSKANSAWLDWAVAGDPLPAEKKPVGKPDPNCPKCHGIGMYSLGITDIHDKRFGSMKACDCIKVREDEYVTA